MGFIQKTVFPLRKASLLAVDSRLEHGMKGELLKWNTILLEIPMCNRINAALSGHPDMQLVRIRENVLICHPHMSQSLTEELRNRGYVVYKGRAELGKAYPQDVAYNVAIIGGRAFHNTKYTDPLLAELLGRYSIRLVHVNQGYTKCSVLAVTAESIITADPSIAAAAKNEGMDVFIIPPQKNIRLPGQDYGFIGGTAGFINKNVLAFAGNIETLDSKDEIKSFLKKHGVEWISLAETPIHDYGGLVPLGLQESAE